MNSENETKRKYVSTNVKSKTTCYHTDLSCRYLQETSNFRERSDMYIEWHGLTECPYCAGEKS